MGAGIPHAGHSEAAAPVTLVPPTAHPHNVPVELTSFVGRRPELDEVQGALAATRLLTLTGPGGCGKTRLAVRTATGLLGRFPDGVWWVDLGSVADGARIGAAIAEPLGVHPLPGMTELQAACAYLAPRRALVVLDTCEHLLDVCAGVVETLLRSAPGVVVLATSRAPLGAEGETDWRVPPLSLPAAPDGDSAAVFQASDAVELFMARAAKVRQGFVLSGDDADAVAAICWRLDGLPLAIELAAARVRMLSVEQIADGLAHRFGLLTTGPRTAAPRQQTLRASVDWSYDLLSADEQVLLRRLAVFAGGFTLEAAVGVCAREGIEPGHMLTLLGSLVDQSLVIADAGDPAVRYRLLDTVREYGLERLAAAGESDALRDRHRDAFLALAEAAAPHLDGAGQREWLPHLDAEAANLAAALHGALATQPARALRFCGALYRWWSSRSRFAEGEHACSRALDAGRGEDPRLRARAGLARTFLAVRAGDADAAGAHALDALAVADEAGDQSTAARTRGQLALALLSWNPGAARTEYGRAAELARACGDDWALAVAEQSTAVSYAYQSRHAEARAALDAVAPLVDEVGDPLHVTWRLLWTAVMAVDDGRFAEAREAMARTRAIPETSEEILLEVFAEIELSVIDVLTGEPERALERLPPQLERALTKGAGMAVPALVYATGLAELAAGRVEQARDRLAALVPLVDGRDARTTPWALCTLAEAQRALGEEAAEATATRAQASGERIGSRLLATRGRYTLGRLAAVRSDWKAAQQHALAHLGACAEGGHLTYVPACLDALAEVAAGLRADRDAVRLFAAADRARAAIGTVRVPEEESHWAAIDEHLRAALGAAAYDAARAEGADLSADDALEWARRARGPRGRPPGGWAALTPTEARIAELVAEGLTNAQVGERMFVSPETVKTHLKHIFRKLGVASRAELAAHVGLRRRT